MIFLDIDVPEYQSMRTQEHKVPELLKTIRGRGTIENSNEFGYDERLHLSFTVNEENLAKFLKVYARFQTLCLIPMFNKNLKKKIYDSYMQYKKRTLANMLVNVGTDEETTEQIVDNTFNIPAKETHLKAVSDFGYKVDPNVNDCLMVFLESFSFKSIQDSSNGYELEMILWVCNDLTFYNGDEISFLENYYECFSSKSEAFKQIDEKIDTIILGGNEQYGRKKIEDNLYISFSNSYNDQKTYNPNKAFEKMETPIKLDIPSKYIAQVEVRAMNNLKRLPIVGKTKGFIQHLGKGEIGVTVKLALNQNNAIEEKIIHDIKSISLYQQEYITTSTSDFFLFKGMDIRELSMSTNIIEEPSDDVDITIVTIFFTGSGTNKKELENSYFQLMDRAKTDVHMKLFNKFLDRVLSDEDSIEINPHLKNDNTKHSTLSPDKKLELFSKMIISKSDIKDILTDSNSGQLFVDGRYDTSSMEKKIVNDFTLKTLINSYKQDDFYLYLQKLKDNYDEVEKDIKLKKGIIRGIGEFFFYGDGIPLDSIYLKSIMYRIERIAYFMKTNYTKGKDKDKLETVLLKAMDKDNETQAEFFEDTFLKFLVEFFDAKFLTNEKNMLAFAVSNVFKIEVINNLVMLLKNMLELDFKTNNIFSFDNCSTEKIITNGHFNPKLQSSIIGNIKVCFETMKGILKTDIFMNKVKDFIITNYYKDADNQEFYETLEKGIIVEIEKAETRLEDFIRELDTENNYIYDIVELMLKLQILGCRLKNYDSISKNNDYYELLKRNENFTITTEIKIYLLTDCIISLFIADLNFEKTVIGALASNSATNFIGPHAVTYTALDTSINEITASIKKITNGKTVDEFLKNNDGKSEDDVKVKYVKEFKNKFDTLNTLIEIYKSTFGTEYLEDLKKLNSTFVKSNSTNKDFQKIHGVRVFAEFDTPMSFLKKISSNSEKFKTAFSSANQDLDKLEDVLNGIDLKKMLSSSSNNGKGKPDNNGINVTGDEEVDKLIQNVTSVFAPSFYIADKTINKRQGNSIVPSTFMQNELLGEFKLLRGLRSATRLLKCQYERMMPDYEVYIIDEKAVERARERGYDYQDKIYSLSNIMSINIKKDDTTNLKHAVIKVLNTMPHYIGLNTVFESQSVFSKNKTPEVVYSNKFVTNKLVFRAGMIVNVSIDQNSQFFDFTGKIDSVDIATDIITIRCSSFASELLGESFNMANVYASGFTSLGTKFKNIYRQFKINPDVISNSKINDLNSNIIPLEYSDGLSGNEKKCDLVVAGATGILYTALEKAIKTIKHLDCPYNKLVLGKNLSDNIDGSIGKFGQWQKNTFKEASETTAHRISENINAVEYDLSFYGIQKATFTNFKEIRNMSFDGMYENLTPTKKSLFIMSHSSFIPKSIQEDVADETDSSSNSNRYDSLRGSNSWSSNQTAEPVFFGYCYSYKRDDVKLYDVLNDIALRNPGAYWDVFESGHYGTLFLGRNNYVISRKNKVSSLSREDVDKISEFAVQIFTKDESYTHRYLATEEYVESLNYLSELAAFYDQSFSKDKTIYSQLYGQLKFNSISKNEFYKETFVANKDLYNEESLASNTILAISGYNLISCSITTNQNYCNTIDIKYKPGIGDRTERFLDFITGKSSKVRLKTFEGLSDDRIRAKAVDPSLTTNLHTKEQAFEYAQSVMFNELRNYYSGKIVILYHPDIKKNDEVILIDSRNKINGVVIVKDFEHILDAEVGAITIITPGMKVTTSSLMTDVYLTGILNKLTYEWLKMDTAKVSKTKINKMNLEAADSLQKLYKNMFSNVNQIPVAFEYTGFNFEFDKAASEEEQKTNKVFLYTNSNNSLCKKNTFDRIYQFKEPEVVLTPRNISSLPFKLYPLINNGKALIPDEDIYNSIKRPFSFVIKLLTSISYFAQNALDFNTNFRNLLSITKSLLGEYDLSENKMYENIVKTYFPIFSDNYRGSKNDKDIFIERLLADSYYGQLLSDINKVNINPNFWDKESVVFFNCQRLTVDDVDRIDEIAKILCQFTVVNVVELSGKTKNGFENGPEFSVVEELRVALEKHSTSLIQKENSHCSSWTTAMQSRLTCESPNGDYDDIGAVFINCDKDTAKNIIKNTKVLEISSTKHDSEIQNSGEYPFEKTVRKKVLTYSLRPNKITHKVIQDIHMFVFHNYFGKELGNESISYEIRRNLLDNLIDYIQNHALRNRSIVMGDFNLFLRDRRDDIITTESANNEYFNLFTRTSAIFDNSFLKLIKDTTTTDGSALYDQAFLTTVMEEFIDKAGVVRYETAFRSENISDHYPIYIFFKRKFIPGTSALNILPKD